MKTRRIKIIQDDHIIVPPDVAKCPCGDLLIVINLGECEDPVEKIDDLGVICSSDIFLNLEKDPSWWYHDTNPEDYEANKVIIKKWLLEYTTDDGEREIEKASIYNEDRDCWLERE